MSYRDPATGKFITRSDYMSRIMHVPEPSSPLSPARVGSSMLGTNPPLGMDFALPNVQMPSLPNVQMPSLPSLNTQIKKSAVQTAGAAGAAVGALMRLAAPSPSAIGTSTAIGSGLDFGSANLHIRYYGYAPVDAENMGRPMVKYLKGSAVEYGLPETAQHLIASGGTLEEQEALQKLVESGYYYE